MRLQMEIEIFNEDISDRQSRRTKLAHEIQDKLEKIPNWA